MEIGTVRRVDADGYPALEIIVDGKRALLTTDAKRTLLRRHGILFLGPEFENGYAVTIPADPRVGQPEQVMRGFTDDPRIVALFLEWVNEPPLQRR